jgi:hypothetical protein
MNKLNARVFYLFFNPFDVSRIREFIQNINLGIFPHSNFSPHIFRANKPGSPSDKEARALHKVMITQKEGIIPFLPSCSLS